MGDLLLECDVYLPISMSVVFHYILIFTGCYWIVMSIASLFLDEDFLFEKIIVAEIVTILVCWDMITDNIVPFFIQQILMVVWIGLVWWCFFSGVYWDDENVIDVKSEESELVKLALVNLFFYEYFFVCTYTDTPYTIALDFLKLFFFKYLPLFISKILTFFPWVWQAGTWSTLMLADLIIRDNIWSWSKNYPEWEALLHQIGFQEDSIKWPTISFFLIFIIIAALCKLYIYRKNKICC